MTRSVGKESSLSMCGLGEIVWVFAASAVAVCISSFGEMVVGGGGVVFI